MTICVYVDPTRKDRRKIVAREAFLEIALHRRLAQVVDGELDALPAYLQGSYRAQKDVFAYDGIGGAVRADHQQSCRFAAWCDRGQQVDGGRVAPVQVLEDEHQGRLGGPRLDEGCALAEHALGPHGMERLLQRVGVRIADQPGHLHQPRWCHLTHQVSPGRQRRAGAPIAPGLRSPACMPRAARAARRTRPSDPYRARRLADRRRVEKGLHQGGLADARRPGHEDDLARAALCLLEECPGLLQLGVAADERAGVGVPGDGHRGLDSVRYPAPSAGHPGDEPEAASLDRLDEAGRPGAVAEGDAQFADGLAHRRLGDRNARSRPRRRGHLGDQHARALGEIAQHRPGLRP